MRRIIYLAGSYVQSRAGIKLAFMIYEIAKTGQGVQEFLTSMRKDGEEVSSDEVSN